VTPLVPTRHTPPPRKALIPGVPHLLAGRLGAGLTLVLLWTALLALALLRWDRFLAAPTGPLDHQLALLTWCGVLAGLWGTALQEVRRQAAAAVEGGARTGERRAWDTALRDFSRHRPAVFGALAIFLAYLLALLTPLIAPFDPTLQGDLLNARLSGPSLKHPLGTDQFARDILSRLLYGARISLAIGLIAVSISITIGSLIGAISGYAGGWIDALLMRLVDAVIAFPRLVLLIAIVALFEPSIFLIVAILGLTQWPQTARLVRGEILSLREREFIQAGRALGFSRPRIILRHLLPNTLGPVIVAATLGIGDTIVLEAGLSFLGLGVQPPTPSWGTMVADGRNYLLGAWWISTFPGLAIVALVLSFNLAGDGLRDALDPRLRGG